MNFNSPIPRAVQPRFHESSALRSVRDGDNNSKAWQKNKDVGKSLNAIAQSVQQNATQISKLRRRMVGGGGGQGGGGYMGEYDKDKTYSAGQTVRVTTAATIVGVHMTVGYYGVPPTVASVPVPTIDDPNTVPQYPEPTSGTVYWHAIIQYCS